MLVVMVINLADGMMEMRMVVAQQMELYQEEHKDIQEVQLEVPLVAVEMEEEVELQEVVEV